MCCLASSEETQLQEDTFLCTSCWGHEMQRTFSPPWNTFQTRWSLPPRIQCRTLMAPGGPLGANFLSKPVTFYNNTTTYGTSIDKLEVSTLVRSVYGVGNRHDHKIDNRCKVGKYFGFVGAYGMCRIFRLKLRWWKMMIRTKFVKKNVYFLKLTGNYP